MATEVKVTLRVANLKQWETAMKRAGLSTQRMSSKTLGSIGKVQKGMMAMMALPYLTRAARAIKDVTFEMESGIRDVGTLITDFNQTTYASIEQYVHSMAKIPQENDKILKAMYQYVSAGGQVNRIQQDMSLYAKAATAGLATVTQATDLGTTMLNAYGMSYKQTKPLMDKFFLTVKYGKTTIGELGQHIGQVATVAATSGLPINDLTSAIALLTKRGIRTPMAMRGLRQAIATLMMPTAKMSKIFESYGITAETLAGKIQQIKEAGLSPSDWKKIVPSMRALTTVQALTNGYEEWMQIQKKMKTEAPGAMMKAYEVQAKSMANQWKVMTKQLQKLGIAIGKDVIPALIKLFNIGAGKEGGSLGTLGWLIKNSALGIPRLVMEIDKWVKAKENLKKTNENVIATQVLAASQQEKYINLGKDMLEQDERGARSFADKAEEMSAYNSVSIALGQKEKQLKQELTLQEEANAQVTTKAGSERAASLRREIAGIQGMKGEVDNAKQKLEGMSEVDFSGLEKGLHNTADEALLAAYKADYLADRLDKIPKHLLVRIRVLISEEKKTTLSYVDEEGKPVSHKEAGEELKTVKKRKPVTTTTGKKSKGETAEDAGEGAGVSQSSGAATIKQYTAVDQLTDSLKILQGQIKSMAPDDEGYAALKQKIIDKEKVLEQALLKSIKANQAQLTSYKTSEQGFKEWIKTQDEAYMKTLTVAQQRSAYYAATGGLGEEEETTKKLIANQNKLNTLRQQGLAWQEKRKEDTRQYNTDMAEIDSQEGEGSLERQLGMLARLEENLKQSRERRIVSYKDFKKREADIDAKERAIKKKIRDRDAKEDVAFRKKNMDAAAAAGVLGGKLAILSAQNNRIEMGRLLRQGAIDALSAAQTKGSAAILAAHAAGFPLSLPLAMGKVALFNATLEIFKGALGKIGAAAEGVYVTKPTLLLAGETGPEFVIPQNLIPAATLPGASSLGDSDLNIENNAIGGSKAEITNNVILNNPIGDTAAVLADVLEQNSEKVIPVLEDMGFKRG